jgi:group I intron endonuclease
MGFIYKITNTKSKKIYIGETKLEDPEKRWKAHIQSINRGKGCPALRDAIKKYGIDTFRFEVLIICFDEDRFEYEKEYIKKYNSQVPNGYNILPGGEGGGFLGKKHKKESIDKIKSTLNKRYENTEERERMSTIIKEHMKKVNMKEIMSKSENYKKAVEEGRVGARAHKDGKVAEETKDKISKSLIEYYKTKEGNKVNIEKHRESMAKSVGRKVAQYSLDNKFIAEYNSISEAGRKSGVTKSNIQHVLSGKNSTAGGFIWSYVEKRA